MNGGQQSCANAACVDMECIEIDEHAFLVLRYCIAVGSITAVEFRRYVCIVTCRHL